MIYYGFHNSIWSVQLKRIISFIDLQIEHCLSLTLFKKGTVRTSPGSNELMPQTRKNFLTISWSWTRYSNPSFTHSIMCWRVSTGSLKLVSLFPSRKPSITLAAYSTQDLLNTVLNGLLRLTSIDWHFEVQPAGVGRISDLLSNNWVLTPWVKCAAKA